MHKVVQPKALYFGTPVVLVSSVNEDMGATNLAPMSSAWWVGRSCMLGLDATSKTTENLIRDGDCVLNLAFADMVGAVDRLALTTGSEEVSEHKAKKGFRYEPNKFSAAGLSPMPSDIVNAERVAECGVQLEAKVAVIPGTLGRGEMGRFGRTRGSVRRFGLAPPATASNPLPRIFIHRHKM